MNPPLPWQLTVARVIIFLESAVSTVVTVLLLLVTLIAASPESLLSTSHGGSGPLLPFLFCMAFGGVTLLLIMTGRELPQRPWAYRVSAGFQVALLLPMVLVVRVQPDVSSTLAALAMMVVPAAALTLLMTPPARHATLPRKGLPAGSL
jgi:hypothetical protein